MPTAKERGASFVYTVTVPNDTNFPETVRNTISKKNVHTRVEQSRRVVGTLVVLGPRVFLEEAVDHFFHGEVRNELVLREVRPRHRVKMTDSLTANTHQHSTRQQLVCVQLPTSADNVTLPTFSAERQVAVAVYQYLLHARLKAANPPQSRAAAE